MDIKVDSIFEKEMLVPGGWKPNESLLMHVASFDDWGAHPNSLASNIEDMQESGELPVRVKFKLMYHIEVVEDYGYD